MGPDGTLVGRRTELDAIGRVLDDAREGRSRVLVVRGAAGVGKSALLDRCVAAADGFRVMRADGVQAEAELPFAGLHQLLRPLAPLADRLPEHQRDALDAALGLAPGRGDRFLAAAATFHLLAEAAEEAPLLCAVDDLQ
jgi:hypothetical protein